MKKFVVYAMLLALPLSAQKNKDAKKDATKEPEVGITRQQADEILDELRQIRQLLEKQANPGAKAPQTAKLNMEGAQMLGSKTAPVTIVEFTDYQCPFCQRFHLTVFNELKKQYIDTGKVRFYSRDLPIDSLHPNATRAAQAARCAADQGQFWKLRDIMGANPDKLDMNSLVADAGSLNMDVNAFRTCIDTGKYKDAVGSDVLEAMRFGLDGTPSFVIGKSTPEGVDGEVMVGALPLSEFEKKMQALQAVK